MTLVLYDVMAFLISMEVKESEAPPYIAIYYAKFLIDGTKMIKQSRHFLDVVTQSSYQEAR